MDDNESASIGYADHSSRALSRATLNLAVILCDASLFFLPW